MPHHHHSHHHHHPSSSSSSRAANSAVVSNVHNGFGLFPRIAKLTQVGDRIPAYIPGLRTSAAFLSSLSANLQIQEESLYPSPISTPTSFRAGSISGPTSAPRERERDKDRDRDVSSSESPLPPPATLDDFDIAEGLQINIPSSYTFHPSPVTFDMASVEKSPTETGPEKASAGTKTMTEELPPLYTGITTDYSERISALKLVADSVAQQRQFASRSLIGHPFNAGLFVVIAAIAANYLQQKQNNWPLVFTTLAGLVMSALVAVRHFTEPYIKQAEKVNLEWLGGDETTVVVTKFGEEVIGTAVLGWEKSKSGKKGKSNGNGSGTGGKGLLRAWTIRLRYRGKGEGKMLLEEAVKVAKAKGWDALEVEEGNIYERRALPKVYNAGFDRRDARVRRAVERAVDQAGGLNNGKKR